MAATERIIFQPYIWEKVGKRTALEPGTPVACRNAGDALRRIEKVRDGLLSVAGAQAVRMTVDEEAGDYGEPEVLGSVGDVPGISE
ncbi:hypothetical protein [Acetobacter cerevisiae]|uniref:hypothetical protein n=1 Tax=Acetobacter cerevisiae TaxID=178900 RepID=UPI00209C8715|nr:hypothetical protein [Acetobacter cerevisiae]MCP1270535.1 hypothetical protein [Acetobacter cerevisiae]MCP1278488.1 hypothetical protein [Acetobacter cerevisiae]